MRYHLLYSYARRHCVPIVIGGAAVSVALSPEQFSFVAMLLWSVLALCMTIFRYVRAQSVAKRFSGRIVEFVFAPTPMGSLIECLSTHHVDPEDIKSMQLMSSDLHATALYLTGSKRNFETPFNRLLEANPEIKVTIYGLCNGALHDFDGISFRRTRDKHVEHTNLITTQSGRHFVWYEPYHEIVKGRHYFAQGAYLVEVSQETATNIHEMFSCLSLAVDERDSGAID